MKSLRIFLFIFIVAIQCARKDCSQEQLTQQQLSTVDIQCFNQKYNPEIHDGHKLSRIVENRLSTYRKILQHLKMHKVKHIETTPVVKWAQTKQKIFINFKLSHRQDSPPCSDVRNQRFIITNIQQIQGKFAIQSLNRDANNSKFDFVGQCFFTNQKFMFKLEMTFNQSLKHISIDREGFGSYTVVGTKNTSQIWIDPFQDVHRAAIWQQMRKRYEPQMNQYFQMRQKRLQESSHKNKRRKKKRPTGKSNNPKQQQNQLQKQQIKESQGTQQQQL